MYIALLISVQFTPFLVVCKKKNEVNILGHTWHTTVGVPFILFMVVCDTKACAYCDKPGTVKGVIDIHFLHYILRYFWEAMYLSLQIFGTGLISRE